MRIIDQELVKDIDPTDDEALSKLGDGTEPYAVVYRDLGYEVLEYVNINQPLAQTDVCLKFKVGQGWIVKFFPPVWNGKTRIIQLAPKVFHEQINKYTEPTDPYVPDGWDLRYTHVWKYENTRINSVSRNFLPKTDGIKEVGFVKFVETKNEFDVIFISYNESNAEENWQRLLTKWPNAKRVDGVKGILNAHKAAAELASTEMFWVVDGDAYIVDDFEFTSVPYDRECVHIWHSKNPVNDLEYGHGGVKLFPKKAFYNIDETKIIDVSASVGNGTIVIKQIACESRFNTDDFNTWRSAFREGAKLAAGVSKRPLDMPGSERQRLAVWCLQGNSVYAHDGAKQGAMFSKQNPEEIFKINDYEWLYEQFSSRQGLI